MSRAFRKTIEFVVGKYTGDTHLSPAWKVLDTIFNLFSKDNKNELGKEETINSFDWDGDTLFTSCDCHVAANLWNSTTKQLISRRSYTVNNFDRESWSTMFSIKCGYSDGVLFGNGSHLFYSEKHESTKKLNTGKFNCNSVNVFDNGKQLVYLQESTSNTPVELILQKRGPARGSKFKEQVIPIDEVVSNHKHMLEYLNVSVFEMVQIKQTYVCLFSRLILGNRDLQEAQDLFLVNIHDNLSVKHKSITGIHHVSGHPSRPEIVVLGERLTILSVESLEIIQEVELPNTRDTQCIFNNVVSHSACGKYLAISYAINGEVEILDSTTLEVQQILGGSFGFPQPEMSWDITGRFLACRFYGREHREATLVVWDIKSHQVVLQTKSSITNDSKVSFKWCPKSTKLLNLIDNQKIEIFELL